MAIPVILACKEKGTFQLLKKEGPQTLDQWSKVLGANNGHLQVALRMLESLQWISLDGNGAYSIDAKSECYQEIPKKILDLYHFPMDFCLTEPKRVLANGDDLYGSILGTSVSQDGYSEKGTTAAKSTSSIDHFSSIFIRVLFCKGYGRFF